MTISTLKLLRLYIVLLTLSAKLKKLYIIIQLLRLVPLRYVFLLLTFYQQLIVGRHISPCIILESHSIILLLIRVKTKRIILLLIISKSLILCFAKQL
jgi:hypothetical protein